MLGLRLMILAFTVLMLAMCALIYRPKRHFLGERPTQGSAWGTAYADERLHEVTEALELLRGEFSLPKDDVFRLHPDDQILEIYKAKYPYGGVDGFELEGLAVAVRKRYGVGLPNCYPLMSVRDLVNVCLEANEGAV